MPPTLGLGLGPGCRRHATYLLPDPDPDPDPDPLTLALTLTLPLPLSLPLPQDVVEMYSRCNKWEKAHRVATEHMTQAEVAMLYITQARTPLTLTLTLTPDSNP